MKVIADLQTAVFAKPMSKVVSPVAAMSLPMSKPLLPCVAGTNGSSRDLSPWVKVAGVVIGTPPR